MWGGSKTCNEQGWGDAGHHHCSLTLPFPNKTWFHISLPVSPLPFSITVVFITHNISFPTPPAQTHSSRTPAPCTHTLTRALSWRLGAPCLPAHPPTRVVLRRPSLPSSLSAPYTGLLSTLQSAVGEVDVNRGKKGNKTSFPPLPSQNHILLPT